VYHELIEETRSRLAHTQTAGLQSRFMRWLYFSVFTRPARLKLVLLPARLLQKLGLYRLIRRSGVLRVLPAQLRKMEQMLPPQGSLWPAVLPARTSAVGARTRTVGLFAGCVGSVMYQDVNRKAVALLAACGAEVLAPRGQICCGAIHHHNAAHEQAMEMARRNIDTFMPAGGDAVDLIVTAIAGCGAMLREYDLLLRDDPRYAERARQFASRVRDISEVLLEMGLSKRLRHPVNQAITYHDACHLAHAQKVVDAPRMLLAKVPGLKLAAMPDSDMCCGAAGTYNLTQPEMARRLAERKLDSIAVTGVGTVAAGNVGCAMHIQSEADARGRTIRVVHPVDILYQSLTGRA
jgi:glycolate oxidase iron-sulfur subunit